MQHITRNILFVLLICMVSTLNAEDCPKGYYNAVYGKKDASLKTAISNVIRPHTAIPYGSGSNSTWYVFYYSDQDENGYCIDMYSDDKKQFGSAGSAISGCNIEHSFAKSWWGGDNNDAYKDCYHLNPSNSTANSSRSNYPLGEPTMDMKDQSSTGSLKVGKATYEGETFYVFEPKDEYKGDFARAYFYMATCYGEELTWVTSSGTGSRYAMRSENDANAYLEFKDWEIEVLLKWHRQDAVSEKEIKRMDAVSNFQHNRNPYIDHPEWVEYIWGNKKGQVLDSTDQPIDTTTTPIDTTSVSPIDTTVVPTDTAYSITEIKDAYANSTISSGTELYVRGYITNLSLKPNNFSKYHSAMIWLSDENGVAQDFELYNCLGMNGVQFTTFDPYQETGSSVISVNSITDASGNVYTIGDQIVAYGKFGMYGSIYELQQNCYITQKIVTTGNVDVTGITLDRTKATILLQKTLTLHATILPNNATNKNITWVSSNQSVATIDDGVVTAVAVGNATITATTEDGAFEASCAITVTEEEVGSYSISQVKNAYSNEEIISGDSVRVKGYITSISVKPTNFSSYHSACIWLSDEKGAEQEFELYNCLGMNSVQFSTFDPFQETGTTFVDVNSITDINGNIFMVGDQIEAAGKIDLYQSSTYELQQDCYITQKFISDQTPTSIQNFYVLGDSIIKYIDNGKLYIYRSGKVYNAQGQKVK